MPKKYQIRGNTTIEEKLDVTNKLLVSSNTLYANTNFGVLKSNPSEAVDVNGDLCATHFNGYISTNDPYWNLSGKNINFSAGNVGIGTTTPSANLHIDGDLHISNVLETNNIFTTNAIGNNRNFLFGSNVSSGSAISIGKDISYSQRVNIGSNIVNNGVNIGKNINTGSGVNSVCVGQNISGVNTTPLAFIGSNIQSSSTAVNCVSVGHDNIMKTNSHCLGSNVIHNDDQTTTIGSHIRTATDSNDSFAIGAYSNVHRACLSLGSFAGHSRCDEKCIIFNGTGQDLPTQQGQSFYIKPVNNRNTGNTGVVSLRYDSSSGEIYIP